MGFFKLLLRLFPVFLLTLSICAIGLLPASAQEEAAPPDYSREDIQGIIQVLEDPAARSKLIQQLTILAKAKGEDKPEKTEVQTAAAGMLKTISARLDAVTGAMLKVAQSVNRFPEGWKWLRYQIRSPGNRAFWIDVFLNIGIAVFLGYVIFHLTRLSFTRARKILADTPADSSVWNKMLRLFGRFLLDLVPLALFTAGVYLTLGLLSPMQKTRLVVLAWTHAFILNRLVIVVSRAVFSARAPTLRDRTSTRLNSSHYS